MSDHPTLPTEESFARLSRLKSDLRARAGETAPELARRIALGIHQAIRDWPDDREGEIGQTIAILAWRKKIGFNPGTDVTKNGEVRALVRYVTGYDAKRAFALAAAVAKLKGGSTAAARQLAEGGGVDRLAHGVRPGKMKRRRSKARRRA